ncbi:MAG TPA: CopG family transcriptional regulator [Candidatus Sulfotelmatobacter sp.]
MRTTLTLDDDVASLLKKEARKSGEPFKQVVNRFLRLGLTAKPAAQKPFKVKPWNMQAPPGLSFDNVHELLDALDGPERR